MEKESNNERSQNESEKIAIGSEYSEQKAWHIEIM